MLKGHWNKLAATLLMGAIFFAPMSAEAAKITKEEIITLSQLNIPAAEIIKVIKKDRTVFKLQVQDILELKQAGVPEEVIKFMLRSSQEFGGKSGSSANKAAPGGGGSLGAPAPVERIKTPEEIAEERRRAREEAIRLLEERKSAEKRQRKTYAQGVLKVGQDLANAGEYVASIQQFETFMKKGNYAPGSNEAYIAQFGIANALAKSNLLQSAANSLKDLVLQGPEMQFYQEAFRDLRRLRKRINYSPPELEELTEHYVGNFSQEFQDEFNYTLGEFFYDMNNYTQSMRFLEQVSGNAEDTAKALYLTGLIQVRNQLYSSALGSFQNSIVAQERNESSREVADLAYLALARIGYESGEYDAAIYYYRKVSKESTKLPIAFYESAWTYFVKGDASRALGTFQALHSPAFSHYYYPELWVLEATIYLNLCHIDETREALKMFDQEVAAYMEPLSLFLKSMRRPADYYNAFVQSVNQVKVHLPERLTHPVLADVEFYRLYKTIEQIEWEIQQLSGPGSTLGDTAAQIMGKLRSLKQAKINEVGIKIQRSLKRTEDEMRKYSVSITEIEIELDQLELDTIDTEIAVLAGQEGEEEATESQAAGALAIVGADSTEWPFEAEYWSDEVGNYRAFVKEKCSK